MTAPVPFAALEVTRAMWVNCDHEEIALHAYATLGRILGIPVAELRFVREWFILKGRPRYYAPVGEDDEWKIMRVTAYGK